MRTLILYATNNGSTKKCAKELSEKIEGAVVLDDLKDVYNLNLDNYTQIIIGGSLYFGNIQKSVTTFIKNNLELLLDRKIGLFVCGILDELSEKELTKIFPKELVEHASAISFFGGELQFDKMRKLEKFMIKRLIKIDDRYPKISVDENYSNLNFDAIEEFAKVFNE